MTEDNDIDDIATADEPAGDAKMDKAAEQELMDEISRWILEKPKAFEPLIKMATQKPQPNAAWSLPTIYDNIKGRMLGDK